ncbi:geranylgeranylglycerol-phosphate geranylgeranyltransferase [Capnocytophaga gingivalis]|jgi:prenyltransferase family protein|uniref:Geranylgeranylglycerol-phosphate geranylgeranyltransferase n=1 Tax=Capnocytophaga gingivalis TaxID=1017 RepID=A0A250FRK3_9FLAO|nr:geranylgeranylglycerol-phosphate geranylgeranyltransferase [Capnocytophaga gingivalis]ATA86646.1 ubiquinone biosynthesis protein UbiA [Capnocytophaga gingivalis]EEK13833.1 putative (S)-2,3-di-O-geranylgeranylglyceryl phosphate synthase [Capnocytophaga gingivalis ATCC 33624]MEB3041711.1 geranylgeranylglycerol-phosphate geranylgeranyltransferase [Capnocytophaga gingivalis]
MLPFEKFIGLFSVVRGYNIMMICIAQYLTAIFILSRQPLRQVLLDPRLFAIVLAGALAVAGGYIINAFYDQEKDLINKPTRTLMERMVGQHTKLSLYFILNFLSVIVASYVSFRAVLFFSIYIFMMWFYSHRIKKIVLVGNIVSGILSIIPFFAIFVYYHNFQKIIFVHAAFLYYLLLAKDFVKDLQNIKGDFALGYHTIATDYGERSSKQLITVLIGLTLVCIYFLTAFPDTGSMKYYFILTAIILLGGFLPILWKGRTQIHYAFLRNLLKVIIVVGVFCIALIRR